HRIEAERGLDRLALEPLAEKAGRRLGEQVEHVALLLEAEPGEPPALQRAVDERAPTLTDVGRRLEREPAEHLGDGLECVVVGGQRLGIALRELAELGLRAGKAAAEL